MRTIAAALLILVSVLTIHFAFGASPPDRPAGVDAQNWIPVSDKMGFVVTTPFSSWKPRDDGPATTAAHATGRRAISWYIPATLGCAL